MPTYEVNWHHENLGEKLEAVERGEVPRLMVFMPPRHGKSTLVSVMFPLWCLGRHPEWYFVQASYNDEISLFHSRRAKALFESEEYRHIFPDAAVIRREGIDARRAAHEWETRGGGGYYAVGVRGGLTGRGMKVGVLDDPHKDRKEADSAIIRGEIVDWWNSTFYTRLTGDGSLVLSVTRWHPEDRAGTLLKEMDLGGEEWEVLELPSECERYRALWPTRYSAEALANIRRAIGEREYTSLYLQKPTRRGGNLLMVDNIQWDETIQGWPDGPWVRFWDLASTEKERTKRDPDWTVGGLVCVSVKDGCDVVWLRDVVAGQWEAPERDRKILATAIRDGPAVRIGVEAVGGHKDTATTMKRALMGKFKVEPVTVSKDKVQRAQPLEAIFEAGNIHVLRAPWNDRLYEDLAGFPDGAAHDDFADMLSGGYAMHRGGVLTTRVMIERFDAMRMYGGVISDLGV